MPELCPQFPLYVKDWLVATRELSHEQRGVYMDLLCFAWERDGLPVDEDAVRRLTGCSKAAWGRVWPALREKWTERDGRLVNERQETERMAMRTFSSDRSRAGAAGAAKRWHSHRSANGTTHGKAVADAMANDSSSSSIKEKDLSVPEVEDPGAREPSAPIELTRGQLQASALSLVEIWNRHAVDPFVRVATETLVGRAKEDVVTALRQHPDLDWWEALVKKLVADTYAQGHNDSGWIADFWWLLKNSHKVAARPARAAVKPAAAPKQERDRPLPPKADLVIASRGEGSPMPEHMRRQTGGAR
jgi:uncharacterized protein YdaU (DUF1376 family)